MKTKVIALATMAVLLLNVVGFAAVDTRTAAVKKQQTTRLISLLPASDAVMVFDSKQFLTDALPKLLSANQPLLSEITTKLGEIQNLTGIDLRKFDQVVAGVSIKQTSPTNPDFQPVGIASGDVNVGSVIAVAKLASEGKYTQETIGGKVVYIFSIKEAAQTAASKTTGANVQVFGKHIKDIPAEVAITALDQNTLAFGTLGRVRETIEAKSRVDAELISLLSVRETTVGSFAIKTQPAMFQMMPNEADALAKDIESIQFLSGSLDVASAGTSLQLMARTQKPEQAAALKDLLDVLQSLGGLLGTSKNPNAKTHARIVKNVKLDLKGNDVSLELLVPQADIDALVAGIKIK